MTHQEFGALRDRADRLIQLAEKENRDLTNDELEYVRDLNMAGVKRQTTPDQPMKNYWGPTRVEPVLTNAPRHFNTRADAHAAGMWLLAQCGAVQSPAATNTGLRAARWCKDNGLELRAQAEGIGTAGGNLVPPVLSESIIKNVEQFGVCPQVARIRTMTSDHLDIPKHSSGLVPYLVGENAAATESDKAWTSVGLTAKKWAVLTRISSEINEDAAISVVDDLAEDAAAAFAEKMDDAWLNGDGGSSYGGVQGIVWLFNQNQASWAGCPDLGSGHDLFSEINASDIGVIMNALPERCYQKSRVSWVVSRSGYITLRRLALAAGGVTLGEMVHGMPLAYEGWPVYISSKAPSGSGSFDDQATLLFGDFAMATELGLRREVTIKVDPSRYLEYDQLGILATTRWDIVNHDLGDSSSAGAVVTGIGQA